MRSFTLSLLFAVYSMALVQPFLPQIAFYAQQDRLAELFCINPPDSGCEGQCYLMRQVRAQVPGQSTPLEAPQPVRSLAPHVVLGMDASAPQADSEPYGWQEYAFAYGEGPVLDFDPMPPQG